MSSNPQSPASPCPKAVERPSQTASQQLIFRVLWYASVFALMALLGWTLSRNFLDVTTIASRFVHAGMFLFSLLLFVVVLFRNAMVKRRRGTERSTLIGGIVSGAFTLLIGAGCLVLAVEAGVRVFPAVSSLAINPGCRYFWPDYFLPHNSLNMSEREPGPKSGLRVLVIGDSYTEGAGVPRDQRFTNLLEERLRKSHSGAEVYNAGACGLDTFGEADVLDRIGDKIQPDIVVVGYCLNDSEGEAQPVTAAPPVLDPFMLGTVQSYAWYRWTVVRNKFDPQILSYSDKLFTDHAPSSPGWQRVLKGMDRIASWCDQRRVRRVMIVFPCFFPGADRHRQLMDQVVAAASGRGFETRSTLDDFDGRWGQMSVSDIDWHPGPSAQPIIARKLAEMIAKPDQGLSSSR